MVLEGNRRHWVSSPIIRFYRNTSSLTIRSSNNNFYTWRNGTTVEEENIALLSLTRLLKRFNSTIDNAAGLWQGERVHTFIVININDRKVRTSNRNKHRLIGTITQAEGGTLIRQTERRDMPLQPVLHLRCVYYYFNYTTMDHHHLSLNSTQPKQLLSKW